VTDACVTNVSGVWLAKHSIFELARRERSARFDPEESIASLDHARTCLAQDTTRGLLVATDDDPSASTHP
jgi:hypothetical protein